MNKRRFALVAFGLLLALGLFRVFRMDGEGDGKNSNAALSEKTAATSAASPATSNQETDPGAGTPEERRMARTKRMWTDVVATEGTALDQESVAFTTARLQGRVPVGRTMLLEPRALINLAELKQGDRVSISLPVGEVAGLVNLVQASEEGGVRVGGGLDGARGSFSLSQSNQGMAGRILLKDQKLAFVVSTITTGQVQVREMALADVMCYPLPRSERKGTQGTLPGAQPEAAPPEHRSRPGAAAVLYLDFDGATVTDPDWNDGKTINAAASTLQAYEITQVFHRVAEDFIPFNINVTTVESDYLSAPVGRRMRVIITPTDAWYGDAGGVAFPDTFSAAGTEGFSSDVPCWVFNSSVDGIAEAVSHELGHTLGLKHDGRLSPVEEYYGGHGFGAGSWGPIMGAAYNRQVTQWSKGEYPEANNQEDDVAIIGGLQPTPLYSLTNNTGYVTDDAGNTTATAAVLGIVAGEINQSGLIGAGSDNDYFTFTLASATTVVVTASPAQSVTKQSNLDFLIELFNDSGEVLTSSNPDGVGVGTMTKSVTAGTYFVRVVGSGRTGSGQDYGYSSYGSMGAYTLTGTTLGPMPPNITAHPASQSKFFGQTAQFTVSATGNPAPVFAWYRRKAGTETWVQLVDYGHFSGSNTNTLTVSGLTTDLNGDQFRCVAINSQGNATSNGATLSVEQAVTFTSRPLSRLLMAGESTTFQVAATGTGTLVYQWKRNGQIIPGATGPTWALTNATRLDSGFYEVIVTDPTNGPASSFFRVQVASPNQAVAGWGSDEYQQLASPAGLLPVVAIAAGGYHGLALKPDGKVVAWASSSEAKAVPEGLDHVIAIAAGVSGSAALKDDGTVVTWGYGTGTVPEGLGEVIDVAVGQYHGVALKADGTVVSWGSNTSFMTPVPEGLTSVVDVATGANYSMALKSDGTVVTWGSPSYDSSSVPQPADLSQVISISAYGSHSLALKADGTVVGWGHNYSGQVSIPDGASPATAIAAGGSHSLSLKADGTVVAWGHDFFGQTQVPSWIGQASAIAAGESFNLALVAPVAPTIKMQPAGVTTNLYGYFVLSVAATGAPNPSYQWRRNGVNLTDGPNRYGANTNKLQIYGVLETDAGNYDVVVTNAAGTVTSEVAAVSVTLPPKLITQPMSRLVAAGTSVTLDATAENAVSYAWSRNGQFLSHSAATLSIPNATAADAGAYTVYVTNSVGTTKAVFYVRVARPNAISAWGANEFGQSNVPADLADIADVSAGVAHTLALRADGKVVAWGRNASGECDVPVGLSGVVQVSAGGQHSLALRADGTVAAWGGNGSGQSSVPIGLSNVVMVSAGGTHSVALKGDGTLVAWGNNSDGQSTVPANMPFARYVSAGMTHNVALTEVGVRGWGRDNYGQSTTNLSTVTAVQAGADHNAYVNWNGTVNFWGAVSYFVNAANVTTISVREVHGLGIKEDGTMLAWGPNASGERAIPSGIGNVQMVAAGTAHSVVAVSKIAPTILTQPDDSVVTTGSYGYFSVIASGATSYRWMRDGVDLADGEDYLGTDTPSLAIVNAQTSDNGHYAVRITNAYGTTISRSASLTVSELFISNYGGGVSNADGSEVTLSVTMMGTSVFTYQWYRGLTGDTTAPIEDATGNSLTVPQTDEQAHYWVRVSKGGASVDSAAFPVGRWQFIDPLFGSAELSATAYGAGRHVVVGTAVGHSLDAINWKRGTIEAGADLRAVVHDGARFVAAGVGGQIFTSTDGVAWERRRAADTGQNQYATFFSSACGNGATVFAGGALMSSTDGINWQWRTTDANGEFFAVRSVVFAAGRFVAVGYGGSNYEPRIYQSTDGATWTRCEFTTKPFSNYYAINEFAQVVYIGGRFVALGPTQVYGYSAYYSTSSDGLTWTVPAFTNAPVQLASMAVGDGRLLSADFRVSADGINWTERPTAPTNHLGALGYGNGVFLALGSNYNQGFASILTSTDLSQWTTRVGLGLPASVTFGNGRFVGTPHDHSRVSVDGVNWTVTPNAQGVQFGSVTFGNGLFVARSLVTGVSHYTSPDGVTWTAHQAKVAGVDLDLGLMTYGGDQWVGTAFGRIYTSDDTANWTQRYNDPNLGVAAIAYGGGRHVAVGYGGRVVVSQDGVNWVAPPRPTTDNLLKLAYGSGVFVACTADKILTSVDGVQWNERALPVKSNGYTGYLAALTWGGGRFLAVYGLDVLSSADGMIWQVSPGVVRRGSPNSTYFEGDLLFANGEFWAVSGSFAKGAMLQREPGRPGRPEIHSLTADRVVSSGSSATLTVSATGAGLTYQWYQGQSGDTTQPVAGADSATFLTQPLTQAGKFWVRIANQAGTVNSASLEVALAVAPAITAQPVDADLASGQTANPSVIATGLPAPTYQWYWGESGNTSHPIAGATSGAIAVQAATSAKRCWVRVSNLAGAVNSTTAVITPWFERTALKNLSLGGVAHGAGRWVVSGFHADDFYSDDGVSWQRTANAFGGQSGGKVTHGNGVFLSCDFDYSGALWRSTDGSNWQKIFVPGATFQFSSVRYAGGWLFALASNGKFATSADGLTWTLRSLVSGATLYDVAHGNGVFVLAAGNKTFVSTDLVSWGEASLNVNDAGITRVAFGAGKFVAVGGGNPGKILASSDGMTWSANYTYTSNGVYDVVYNGSRFAVSAVDHVILSRDGSNWRLANFPGTHQIAAGDGAFLAVGWSAWQSASDIPPGPVVTDHPDSVVAALGQSVILNVVAKGDLLSYQWQRQPAAGGEWAELSNGGNYAGTSTDALTISALTLSMSGDRFRCVISNLDGTTNSQSASITVLGITEQELNRLAKLHTKLLQRSGTTAELSAAGAALAGSTQTLAGLYQSLLQSSEYLAREKERAIRLYYATFSRMPDQGGLYYWAAVLGGGSMTPTQVATAFAQSQEFLDTYGNLGNEAYITQLYRNTLGRDPDAGGLAYWVGQMNAGLTRGQMLLAFADSQEFTDRMAPEIEVVRLYHLLFDRMPTTQEYNNWRGFVRGYDQTETILTSTEFNTLHPSGLTNAQYVQAVFQGFLLRAADQATQDSYTALLGNSSLSRAELIHQIMDSGEFRTTVVPVTRHYLAVFLRAPDLVGSTHWTNQMRAGLGFTQLSQVFADSAEFASSYAGLTDTQFVSQMYLNILGRPADTGGLNHWVNLFATGQSDEAGLLLSFVLSWEAGWRFAPDIRTIGHYQAFYGRSPTNTELTFWKDYLTSLPAQFRQELIESEEFTNNQ